MIWESIDFLVKLYQRKFDQDEKKGELYQTLPQLHLLVETRNHQAIECFLDNYSQKNLQYPSKVFDKISPRH